MHGGNTSDGADTAPQSAGIGASKKQQRIADLVKEQLHGQLKEELEQALEARLAQWSAPAAPAGAEPGRASRVIPPGGAGAPAPDLREEYARRLGALRPGDLAAVLELKREFRKRGLEVY
ncbi:MAG: hypothetical protein KF701_04840 [Anaerolineales bacterium]|nr:MAG: hypothetical protein KF701_04840 [Anaerolineales bacterium]